MPRLNVKGLLVESSSGEDVASEIQPLPLRGRSPPAIASKRSRKKLDTVLKEGMSEHTFEEGSDSVVDELLEEDLSNGGKVPFLSLLKFKSYFLAIEEDLVQITSGWQRCRGMDDLHLVQQ